MRERERERWGVREAGTRVQQADEDRNPAPRDRRRLPAQGPIVVAYHHRSAASPRGVLGPGQAWPRGSHASRDTRSSLPSPGLLVYGPRSLLRLDDLNLTLAVVPILRTVDMFSVSLFKDISEA